MAWLNRGYGQPICVLLLCCSCSESTSLDPELSRVDPGTVTTLARTAVTIIGKNLLCQVNNTIDAETPPVLDDQFAVAVGDTELEAEAVTFENTRTLRVMLPAGLPVGEHDVTVTTPSEKSVVLPAGLSVVQDPVGLSVFIEDAPSGQGSPVTAMSLSAGEAATFYAVLRDPWGEHVADIEATWRVEGSNAREKAEIRTGPCAQSTFRSGAVGSFTVTATVARAVAGRAGPIYVGAAVPTRVVIVDLAAAGKGELDARDLTTDDTVPLRAMAVDAFDNPVGPVEVAWSVTTDIGVFDKGIAEAITLDLVRPGIGRVRIVHDTLGEDDTGNFVVRSGAVVLVRIESAPGGQGEEIASLTLDAGARLLLYAVGYDSDRNYAADVAVTWRVKGGIGMVEPQGPGPQTTFTATTIGVGQLEAMTPGMVGDLTGNIQVVGGAAAQLSIETEPNGHGALVGDLSMTADESVAFYAVSRDIAGNFVSNEAVTWQWAEDCDDLQGLGGAGAAPSVTFSAASIGSCRLRAMHETLPQDETGTITVAHGVLTGLFIETAPDGSGVSADDAVLMAGGPACAAGAACLPTCGACTFYAVARDADGNFHSLEEVSWEVFGSIGSVSPTFGRSTEFVAAVSGNGKVSADLAAFNAAPDRFVALSVVHGAAESLAIEDAVDGSGRALDALHLAEHGTVTLHAVGRDVAGNPAVLECAEVTWFAAASLGRVFPTTGCTTVFTAAAITGAVANGDVSADAVSLPSTPDDRVTVTVNEGTITRVHITRSPDGPCSNDAGGQYTTDDTLTLYAVGCDAQGHVLGLVDADAWSLDNAIGTLSTSHGTSVTARFFATGDVSVLVSDSLGSAETGPISVGAGVLARVVILDESLSETSALIAQALETVSLQAEGRDAAGVSVGPVEVAWYLDSAVGTVAPSFGDAVVFTATTVGTATLRADHAEASDAEVSITVTPGAIVAQVRIEDAPGGVGNAIDALTLNADQHRTLYAVGRDGAGNFIRDVEATWMVEGGIGTFVSGDGSATSKVLDATTVGVGRVSCDDGLGIVGSTGPINVTPGALHHLGIELSAGDPKDVVTHVDMFSGYTQGFYAVGRDADDNFRANESVHWFVETLSGQVLGDAPGATSVLITLSEEGEVLLRAVHANVDVAEATCAITVKEPQCGNGLAEADEVCDETDLRGETCLSRGRLQGAGELLCGSECQAFVEDGCGEIIDTESALREALEAAQDAAKHTVVRIAGSLMISSTIVIDECGGTTCSGGRPYGVTLEPLHESSVALWDAVATGPMLEIRTGNNRLEDLRIEDADNGIVLAAGGAYAGGNVLTHLYFRASHPVTAEQLLVVASDDNLVVANRFEQERDHQSNNVGGVAITVRGGRGNTVAMNVVYGPYDVGLAVEDVMGRATFIDHNSFWIRPYNGLGGTGVRLQAATGICYRNNIVAGDEETDGTGLTGLEVRGVAIGGNVLCGGIGTQNNVNVDFATPCAGDGCADLCSGGGPLCDRNESPGYVQSDLCLGPYDGSQNPLVDAGVDVGRDMRDGSPYNFVDSAPEVGAVECHVGRVFGGVGSYCSCQ